MSADTLRDALRRLVNAVAADGWMLGTEAPPTFAAQVAAKVEIHDALEGARAALSSQEEPPASVDLTKPGDSPWRVERDTRYYGDRTAAIYRVHWSSRVAYESESNADAIAVCAALNWRADHPHGETKR